MLTVDISPLAKWTTSDHFIVIMVDDNAAFFNLNQLGYEIWTELASHQSVEQILSKLHVRFPDTSASILARDFTAFLQKLSSKGIVSLRQNGELLTTIPDSLLEGIA